MNYNRLIQNLSSYPDLIISVLDRRCCGLFPYPGIPVPSAPCSWSPTHSADWAMDLHTAQPWPYKPGNTANYLRQELTRELRIRSRITNQNNRSWIQGSVQIALYHSCKECHLAGRKIFFNIHGTRFKIHYFSITIWLWSLHTMKIRIWLQVNCTTAA